MTFTFEHFFTSILILIAIAIFLLFLFGLGLAIFRLYCSFDNIIDKFTVEKLIDERIYSVMEQHNSNLHPNFSNALKSKNKIKSTNSGRK